MVFNILENETIILEEQGTEISLIGLEDPDTFDRDESVQTFILDVALKPFGEDDRYKILLSHRIDRNKQSSGASNNFFKKLRPVIICAITAIYNGVVVALALINPRCF